MLHLDFRTKFPAFVPIGERWLKGHIFQINNRSWVGGWDQSQGGVRVDLDETCYWTRWVAASRANNCLAAVSISSEAIGFGQKSHSIGRADRLLRLRPGIQIRDNQAELAGELRLLNHTESFYGVGNTLNVVELLFQQGDTSEILKWIITN